MIPSSLPLPTTVGTHVKKGQTPSRRTKNYWLEENDGLPKKDNDKKMSPCFVPSTAPALSHPEAHPPRSKSPKNATHGVNQGLQVETMCCFSQHA
jgi:hypothetical protein